MSELELLVNGRKYGGWKSIRVTRTIESLAGSFDLEASDRWGGQDEIWPIFEEDACRVTIDGETVIDGYIDHRAISLSASSRTLNYQGRDKSAALVDNSALLNKWSFSDSNVIDISKKVAAPFGIPISVEPGLVTSKTGLAVKGKGKKVVINPGDSPYHVMQRAAAEEGVLLISDGRGGVLITRSGTRRIATALVQGENLLGISIDYDATGRFRRYVVGTQGAGTDWVSGEAISSIHGEATDLGVRRTERVLFIRPETGFSSKLANQRADWEARVRAAKAATVTAIVNGWRTAGEIWPLNVLVTVHAPAIGIDGELLVSEVEHTIGDGGEVTQVRLMRPDAFLPEVHAVVKGEGAWKELAKGVKL